MKYDENENKIYDYNNNIFISDESINEKNHRKHNERLRFFGINIYPTLLIGFILFSYGNDVSLLFSSLDKGQSSGLSLIAVSLSSYFYVVSVDERKKRSTIVKKLYKLMRICLFISLFFLTLILLGVLTNPWFCVTIFIIFTFYIIFTNLFSKTINAIIYTFKNINNEVQQLTIIIGFFGVLISILTYLK